MTKNTLLLSVFMLFSCNQKPTTNISVDPISIDLEQANRLSKLPMECISQEYPNKLGQVLENSEDLKTPFELRPAFYGCFDWHSAVHGHWSLMILLNKFPDLENRETIISTLQEHLSAKNITTEIAFFNSKNNSSFERTYGWAWLLKLAEALHQSKNPQLSELERNLQPLTDLIVEKYINFLPKLIYPIRTGEHSNTAFGLSLAWDYAVSLGNFEFQNVIKNRALNYYQNDKNCPLTWEPSGYDFLSPCLEEAYLMSKILEKDAFKKWLDAFLPNLKNTDFNLEIARVSDRQDGKLVHLDGLNFSRAWCLKGIAQKANYPHLMQLAYQHIASSLPNLVGDSYEGGHWLGTFAIYSLLED